MIPQTMNPERQAHETQAHYRMRQAEGRAVFRAMTKPPRQAPSVGPTDVFRFFLGQHTNPKKNEQKKASAQFSRRNLRRQCIDIHRALEAVLAQRLVREALAAKAKRATVMHPMPAEQPDARKTDDQKGGAA